MSAAGATCLALAILHVVLIPIGAPAYRYFGAGERMARMAEAGSATPAALTLAVAAALALCGLYGLSGGGWVRPLPLRRAGLALIGTVFVLRGLSVGPQVWYLIRQPGVLPVRYAVFSAVALVIGLLFVAGLAGSWQALTGHQAPNGTGPRT